MDTVEKIGKGSIIQHGKFNDRIYLMKLFRDDYPNIIDDIDSLAEKNQYSKIIAKIPPDLYNGFNRANYLKEACIPEQCIFMSRFLSNKRQENDKAEKCNDIIKTAIAKEALKDPAILSGSFIYRRLAERHADDIVSVYKTVFKTYPFPIHDRDYILKTMQDNVIYFGIFCHNELVAVSSTEIDHKEGSVEMTDFSTLPEYRGNGFAVFLLQKMEIEMVNRNILKSYTIARALSYGMNITFSKNGYKFGGTLVNNTNISGNIESMNIWYKDLSAFFDPEGPPAI